MVEYKPGVSPDGLKAEMRDALPVIERVVLKHRKPCVITSTTDGKHKKNSKHYQGLAVDLRTWGVKSPTQLRHELIAELGPKFDVVIEKSHIHVERDDKYSHFTMQGPSSGRRSEGQHGTDGTAA